MRHVVVIAWLVFIGFVGVRGLLVDDARFGWGMFPEVLTAKIEYRWALADGSFAAHHTGKELRGQTKKLKDGKKKRHWYGRGALLGDVEAYAAWAVREAKRPDGARAFEAVVR